jgi:hypothetical protein
MVPINAYGLQPGGGIYPNPSPYNSQTFDLAQILSSDMLFVGWAAYWPSCSDWSADGGRLNQWWQSLEWNDIHAIDGVAPSEPFLSPYTIGEWDFLLTSPNYYDVDTKIEGDLQFRGVTKYGLTDLHDLGISAWSWPNSGQTVGDGDDENRTSGANVIEREVAYQLQENFLPWDLKKSAHKASSREVTFKWSSGTSIPLPATQTSNPESQEYPLWTTAYNTDGTLGNDPIEVEEWYAYCTFAERVIDLSTGNLLARGEDYTITVGTDKYDCSVVVDAEYSSHNIKVLYSVEKGSWEWISVGRDRGGAPDGRGSATVDSAAASLVSEAWDSIKDIDVTWAAMDVLDSDHWTVPFLMSWVGPEKRIVDWYYDWSGGDNRTALKDDWSTTVPIASSNIIAVGGPVANAVAEYFNEFTPVIRRGIPAAFEAEGLAGFFAIEKAPDNLAEDLLPVSCWGWQGPIATGPKPPLESPRSQTPYNLSRSVHSDVGYAVVTTYKDINGTVGFNVWGMTGNDTYWASVALWNAYGSPWENLCIYKHNLTDTDGNGPDSDDPIEAIPINQFIEDRDCPGKFSLLEFLQVENEGITSIILEIHYNAKTHSNDIHPEIHIVEQLGTISEKPQHDP